MIINGTGDFRFIIRPRIFHVGICRWVDQIPEQRDSPLFYLSFLSCEFLVDTRFLFLRSRTFLRIADTSDKIFKII